MAASASATGLAKTAPERMREQAREPILEDSPSLAARLEALALQPHDDESARQSELNRYYQNLNAGLMEQGRGGGRTCFNCGQMGHFRRDCPNQSKETGDDEYDAKGRKRVSPSSLIGLGLTPRELFKTSICLKWKDHGFCPYAQRCIFAHGRDELRRPPRQVPKEYKTKVCAKYYLDGWCHYGSRCHFIHPVDGIQPRDDSHLKLLRDKKFTTKLRRQSDIYVRRPGSRNKGGDDASSTAGAGAEGDADQADGSDVEDGTSGLGLTGGVPQGRPAPTEAASVPTVIPVESAMTTTSSTGAPADMERKSSHSSATTAAAADASAAATNAMGVPVHVHGNFTQLNVLVPGPGGPNSPKQGNPAIPGAANTALSADARSWYPGQEGPAPVAVMMGPGQPGMMIPIGTSVLPGMTPEHQVLIYQGPGGRLYYSPVPGSLPPPAPGAAPAMSPMMPPMQMPSPVMGGAPYAPPPEANATAQLAEQQHMLLMQHMQMQTFLQSQQLQNQRMMAAMQGQVIPPESPELVMPYGAEYGPYPPGAGGYVPGPAPIADVRQQQGRRRQRGGRKSKFANHGSRGGDQAEGAGDHPPPYTASSAASAPVVAPVVAAQ